MADFTSQYTGAQIDTAVGNVLTADTQPNSLVSKTDIGTDPNQVPLNQYLGQLAFVSAVMKRPPGSATAQGNTGDIAQDGSYFYVCTDLNTWKRVQLTTW